MRTQVGIIGAGPAGLMLARLLRLQGIDSIIIENRSRDYIENRIRAGLIEHWAADLLVEAGVGERMQREGLLHWGINIGINGDLHRIDFKKLVDKRVTIYGQQEVVKDLVARGCADGGELLFEVDGVSVHDFTGDRPKIRFTHEGKPPRDRMRFHRRLRRLPRHLPAEHSRRRAHRVRARLPVRLARHSVGIASRPTTS